MKHLRLVFALCLCLLWSCEPPFWAYYDAESFVVGYVDCEGWRDTSDNPHNMSLGLKYDNHLSLRHNDDVTYYKYDSKEVYPVWYLAISIAMVTMGTWFFVKPFIQDIAILWIFVAFLAISGALLLVLCV